MADGMHVPFLTREALIAAHMVIDPRDMLRPLLPFFRRRPHDGRYLQSRTRKRKPGDNRFVDLGGKAIPVRRGTLEGQVHSPLVIKLEAHISADEVAYFRKWDEVAARGPGDMAEEAGLAEAVRRLMTFVEELTDDAREMRHVICAGALQGGYTFEQDGVSQTVDFSLPTLTNPGTAWDQAGATIVADIRGWIEEFQDQSEGHPPTHVFYNPAINSNYLTQNTEWNTIVKSIPSLARGLLGSVGGQGSDPGAVLNSYVTGEFVDPMFGLQWVPIRGKYLKHSTGTLTERWPVNKLTLAALATGPEAVMEWGMLETAYNPTPGINFDTEETRNPIGMIGRCYDNGAALILRPERVQTVDVDAG